MLNVSGYQKLCSGSLRALQENVIVGIRTGTDFLQRLHPPGLLSYCAKGISNFLFAPLEPRATDDFFVFGIDVRAYAHFDILASKSCNEHLPGIPEAEATLK